MARNIPVPSKLTRGSTGPRTNMRIFKCLYFSVGFLNVYYSNELSRGRWGGVVRFLLSGCHQSFKSGFTLPSFRLSDSCVYRPLDSIRTYNATYNIYIYHFQSFLNFRRTF